MREHCFALNNSAQHVVDLNNGKFVTNDEALLILKRAQEEGLILQPGNALDPNFICCCCGCCCDLITNIKKLERPWELFHSNFIASVDSNLCIGCESCLNRCQMDAIEMVENIATVNQKLCIGCGNCVVTCSEEAITLKKKEKEIIPPNTTKDLFLKIMVKKAELRRKEKGVL
jgi:NAD-dependent dihydropyrimidine dehydrogenase PreA subunit